MTRESKRSSIPPCPGIKFEESFTPISRLKIDSTKSPNWPKKAITKPGRIRCANPTCFKKMKLNIPAVRMAPRNPPTNHSTVLFGLIAGDNLCLPKFAPTKYAAVSIIQIAANRNVIQPPADSASTTLPRRINSNVENPNAK